MKRNVGFAAHDSRDEALSLYLSLSLPCIEVHVLFGRTMRPKSISRGAEDVRSRWIDATAGSSKVLQIVQQHNDGNKASK